MSQSIIQQSSPRRKPIDLVGKTFGRLTVLSEADRRRSPGGQLQRYLFCKCVCGKTATVHAGNLRSGHTSSCGCFHDDNIRTVNLKHGHSHTAIFVIWQRMRDRCEKPHTKGYASYGGRGIKVCRGWRESFPAFLADMGEQPPGKWIDRIDTNGHYSCGHCPECLEHGWPANCRWATPIEQNNNRRDNIHLTFQGRTKTLPEWARERGMKPKLLWKRLFTFKWSIERSLTQPLRHWPLPKTL